MDNSASSGAKRRYGAATSNASTQITPRTGVADLNPTTQSIEVFKSASTAAIYGSLAASRLC
ncbi:MAG: hypothetical protein IPQ28_14195 [Sphingobacteriales bacterium]|nr:hypothetical protein [Sphingobacteriales bacterium]